MMHDLNKLWMIHIVSPVICVICVFSGLSFVIPAKFLWKTKINYIVINALQQKNTLDNNTHCLPPMLLYFLQLMRSFLTNWLERQATLAKPQILMPTLLCRSDDNISHEHDKSCKLVEIVEYEVIKKSC